MQIKTDSREIVVLIHGWFSNRLLMWPMQYRFERSGYRTRNFGYPSLRQSIEAHAENFGSFLKQLNDTTEAPKFHIVAHSMGSIITRRALTNHRFEKLGRIVFLCPPNRGSHMASRVSRLIRGAVRTLDEIADRPNSFVNQLSLSTEVPIGIIAAAGDLVVNCDATRMNVEADFLIVPGMHNSVLFKPSIIDLCRNFLQTGNFKSANNSAQPSAKLD